MDPDVITDKPGNCPKCGMKLVQINAEKHDHHNSMEEDFKKRFFITLPLVLLTMLLSPMIQMWLGINFNYTGREFTLFILGTIIFVYGGFPFFKGARGELSAKNPAMMTLVALAITIGYIFSVAATFFFPEESLYWEISTLIAVFLLGHWLEMRAVRGTTGALAELTKLIPPTAHLFKNGEITDVNTQTLNINDRILIKPGEKIPIDGIVTSGESDVNESMITGESRPVPKKEGDKVIGGTINQDGSLTIEVNRIGAETVVSQISKLIRDAQNSKPNVQHLADRAAGVLTYTAVIAGISAFIYWLFINPNGVVFAATLAVSAVVVACPHALGLAIPTVTTITSTLGAKNGILIKDMKALEIAKKVDYVVFDKTGTLTEGRFGVKQIISDTEILSLAAAVEIKSQHSIARGIVEEAKKRNLTIPEVENFISFPGKGASGIVNGKKVTVGNKMLISGGDDNLPKDATPIYVAVDDKYMGVILVSDTIRPEAGEAINRLHQMNIKVAMLTGDIKEVANLVGKQLNIDTVFAQVLPEDKVNKIKELQQKGHIVAMVGDGVNDAPGLTQAHVGIAIGAGTDVAVESAGIVLMKNNPEDVVKAISLSRKTNAKMVQNLIWATGYNVFAIPLAAGALYPSFGILLRPEWSAILMSASSIIVVFNALLLKRVKL